MPPVKRSSRKKSGSKIGSAVRRVSSDFENLRSKNQEALFSFLLTDIDMGLTLVDMARTGNAGDRSRRKQKALEVVSTMKRFRVRLDPDKRQVIDVRLAELEKAISTV